jgi:hypothetical protein
VKEETRHRLAFDLYVRMGAGRSLDKLRQALKNDPSLLGLKRAPSLSTLEAWSSAFHWQGRLLDVERQAAQRDREEQVKALQEMSQRHAREGLALQQKGIERLRELPPGELAAADAIRAVIEGVRLERLSRGVPTDHVCQEGDVFHGHIDLTNFTNEELLRLAQLADRRAAGAGETESR